MRPMAALALGSTLALVVPTSLAGDNGAAVREKSEGDPARKADERNFLERHSDALLILVIATVLVATLIVLVPQLLRAHLRKAEMAHLEHLKALENGHNIDPGDERSRMAARTALLVPMVVMIAAGAVTCFLVVYRETNLFT